MPLNGMQYVIFTATFYRDTTDVRYKACLRSLQSAQKLGITVIVVDASAPEIGAEMAATGAIVSKQVCKGKKGAALREAAKIASEHANSPETLLCWQVGLNAHPVIRHLYT